MGAERPELAIRMLMFSVVVVVVVVEVMRL